MHGIFVNPISISFVLFTGLVIAIVSAFDGNLLEAVATVLIPYFTDVAQRFAKETSTFINAFLATAQLAMFILIAVYSRSGSKRVRIWVSTFGVFLVVSYFLCLVAVMFIGSIH